MDSVQSLTTAKPRQSFGPSAAGTTSIEYALIAASIALVVIVALVQLGDSIRDLPFPALIAAFEEAVL